MEISLKTLSKIRGPLLIIGAEASGNKDIVSLGHGHRESERRCEVHQTANVLNTLPKSVPGVAKGHLEAQERLRLLPPR